MYEKNNFPCTNMENFSTKNWLHDSCLVKNKGENSSNVKTSTQRSKSMYLNHFSTNNKYANYYFIVKRRVCVIPKLKLE